MSDTSALTTWFKDATKRKLDKLNAAFAPITRKKIKQFTETDEMKEGTMATMGKSAHTGNERSGQIYEETSKDTRKRQQEMLQEGAAAARRFLAQTQKCIE